MYFFQHSIGLGCLLILNTLTRLTEQKSIGVPSVEVNHTLSNRYTPERQSSEQARQVPHSVVELNYQNPVANELLLRQLMSKLISPTDTNKEEEKETAAFNRAKINENSDNVDMEAGENTTTAYDEENGDNYMEVHISVAEGNDDVLRDQLEYLQLNGKGIQSHFKVQDRQKDIILLNQAPNLRHRAEAENLTDISWKEKPNLYNDKMADSVTTTIDSSNVNFHKIINVPLLSTKDVHGATVADKLNESNQNWLGSLVEHVKTKSTANEKPFREKDSDVIHIKTNASKIIESGSERYESPTIVAAEQAEKFVYDQSESKNEAFQTMAEDVAVTDKSATAIELHKESGYKSNLTMGNKLGKPLTTELAYTTERIEVSTKPGNYLGFEQGSVDNNTIIQPEHHEVQTFIKELYEWLESIDVQTNLNVAQVDPNPEISNDSGSMNTKTATRILHEDIGITINCLTTFTQPAEEHSNILRV